jgi:surfactin synthase thioesterase subunit
VLGLLCFHHAGGSAGSFRGWGDALHDVAAVRPVNLPGRVGQPPLPPGSLQEQVPVVLPDVVAQGDAPFVLFGHSLGALLAFELSRELARRCLTLPSLLIVSGHRAPHLPNFSPSVHDRTDDALLEAVGRWGMVPEEVRRDATLRRLAVAVLRQDLHLAETYRYSPGPPLACPIVAFGGRHDPRVPPDEIRRWRDQTSGGFTPRILDGGHFFWSERPQAFLGDLRRILRQVPGARAGSPVAGDAATLRSG